MALNVRAAICWVALLALLISTVVLVLFFFSDTASPPLGVWGLVVSIFVFLFALAAFVAAVIGYARGPRTLRKPEPEPPIDYSEVARKRQRSLEAEVAAATRHLGQEVPFMHFISDPTTLPTSRDWANFDYVSIEQVQEGMRQQRRERGTELG